MALVKVDYFSRVLGMDVTCDVILPQKASRLIGMETAERSGGTPVLWLLHGASDDETIWQRRTSIERYAADLGIAVVMPCTHRSWYTDTATGMNYWTYVSQELVETCRDFFPNMSSDREDTWAAGLSMGGYGALKAALSRPDRYAAAAGLSSVCDLAWVRSGCAPLFDAVFGADYVPAPPNDLFAAAEAVARLPEAGRPKLFQYCGTDDFLWADNLRLREHFRALGLAPHWEEGPGGHTWENWDERIRHVLDWLPLEENRVKTGSIGV